MTEQGVALVDDYARLGLLQPPTHASEPTKSHPSSATAQSMTAGTQQDMDMKPPELLQIVEFPDPLHPSKTQTLTLERYEGNGREESDEFKDSTILVRRKMNRKGKTITVQIEIQSKNLQKAVKKAAKGFNYEDLTTEPVIITKPYRGLFFLQYPLKEQLNSPKTKPRLREEINLLLDFMGSSECLGPLISKYNELVPNNKVTFDILWMLFRPFELVYLTVSDFDECFLVQNCRNAISLDIGRYLQFSLLYTCHDGKKYGVKTVSLSIPKFSGTVQMDTNSLSLIPLRFLEEDRQERSRTEFTARAKTYLQLQKARFTMKLHEGPLWILSGAFLELAMEIGTKQKQVDSNGRVVIDAIAAREMLPNESTDFIATSIEEVMVGSRRHSSSKNKTQRGKGNDKSKEINTSKEDGESQQTDSSGTEDSGSETSDSETASSRSFNPYKRLGDDITAPLPLPPARGQNIYRPQYRPLPQPMPPPVGRPHTIVPGVLRVEAEDEETEEEEVLSDTEYIICQSSLLAFMLDRKAWVKVLVEDLMDIDWYPDPWETLQLENETKSLIKTLVEGFSLTDGVFPGWDDIVEGKGKGLIFLLHGLPGLGKTFTAEAIAEQTRRPLYQVSTGELSTDVMRLENQLRQIFRLGGRWGAIVLIDEADVIMAERDISDLRRSAIVAVFLRMVEYYRGLLFLTTNKVEQFDPALYNRIHAMIEYPALGKDSRVKIWKNLLHDRKRGRVDLDASWDDQRSLIYDLLGDLEMNGRDIRNLIRAAYGVAQAKSVPLGVRHITRILTHICRAPNGEEIAMRLEFATRKTNTFSQQAEGAGSTAANSSASTREHMQIGSSP